MIGKTDSANSALRTPLGHWCLRILNFKSKNSKIPLLSLSLRQPLLMAKNAVYFPVKIYDYTPELKGLCVLFDKVYINAKSIPGKLINDYPAALDRISQAKKEAEMYDYLQDKGMVVSYENFTSKQQEKVWLNDPVIAPDLSKRIEKEWPADIPADYGKEEGEDRLQTLYKFNDVFARIDAMELAKTSKNEFYPILKSERSFEEMGKKTEVVHFILNDIPTPDSSVPWEKIHEFRQDADSRNKYLALMDWINRVAASPDSIGDIRERYEYLYNDYIKHFELHKVKYAYTGIEIIFTAMESLLLLVQSSGLLAPLKNLVKVRLSEVNLMQEEGKLPGKELAYIYKANAAFSA